MSGPIVRSGASPEFSEGWDRIFGKGQGGGQKSKAAPAKAAAKSTKKIAEKKAPAKGAPAKKGAKKK